MARSTPRIVTRKYATEQERDAGIVEMARGGWQVQDMHREQRRARTAFFPPFAVAGSGKNWWVVTFRWGATGRHAE